MDLAKREALKSLLNDPLAVSAVKEILDADAWEYIEDSVKASASGSTHEAAVLSAKAEALHNVIEELQYGLQEAEKPEEEVLTEEEE